MNLSSTCEVLGPVAGTARRLHQHQRLPVILTSALLDDTLLETESESSLHPQPQTHWQDTHFSTRLSKERLRAA